MRNFQNLLSRKMERREFLVFLGLTVLSVSGISGILKNLSSLDTRIINNNKKTESGFGSSSYGGKNQNKIF